MGAPVTLKPAYREPNTDRQGIPKLMRISRADLAPFFGGRDCPLARNPVQEMFSLKTNRQKPAEPFLPALESGFSGGAVAESPPAGQSQQRPRAGPRRQSAEILASEVLTFRFRVLNFTPAPSITRPTFFGGLFSVPPKVWNPDKGY